MSSERQLKKWDDVCLDINNEIKYALNFIEIEINIDGVENGDKNVIMEFFNIVTCLKGIMRYQEESLKAQMISDVRETLLMHVTNGPNDFITKKKPPY